MNEETVYEVIKNRGIHELAIFCAQLFPSCHDCPLYANCKKDGDKGKDCTDIWKDLLNLPANVYRVWASAYQLEKLVEELRSEKKVGES